MNNATGKQASKSASASAPPAPSCAMVLFGAKGDLTKRLLIPALYNLITAKLLPDSFVLLGIDHNESNDQDFRDYLSEEFQELLAEKGAEFSAKKIDKQAWKFLSERTYFLQGEFDDKETYNKLGARLDEVRKIRKTEGNVLFYLAVSPRFFAPIIQELGKAGLTREENKDWRRVIIEKPFGSDVATAKKLNSKILHVLNENQTYRIDHFLGKETVQNIMVFRFANGIFEPLWNRDHIDHIQISVPETVTVEERGSFYEKTGALRDMVPNHLFQLLTFIAMEPPTSFNADSVRTEKMKVLESCVEFAAADPRVNSVRGQYGAGKIHGKAIKAYRDEDNVDRHSGVETFAALKLGIDNWRWAGVPFYIRTGKALAKRKTEIAIKFKQAPTTMFRDTPITGFTPNFMVLNIQPNEGVLLQFGAKEPGPLMHMASVGMEFHYSDYFASSNNVGYETLIYDCMIGDAMLFQRADNIEAGWQVVQPTLDLWQSEKPKNFPNYAAGSWGPEAAQELLTRDGREWRTIGDE